MTPPNDFDLIAFAKDWIFAPALAIAAWAWNRNQKEHDDLWAAHDKLQSNTSTGYSSLNDKMMEHVDGRFEDVKEDAGKRIDKVNEHITRLFQNAEQDRKDSHLQFESLRKDMFDRHIELMSAIHAKADK